MCERAATGALVARRSRGASGAAACAPARPPHRSRGRRGELSKSSQERGWRCFVVTVVGLAVQCVTGPGRPRLGVQRPGPGPTVAHGYPGARRCASSAVRFAWCLARTPILGFDVFGVNIVSVGVKTLQTRAQRPPLCLL